MTPAAARFGRPQGIPLSRHGAQPSFSSRSPKVELVRTAIEGTFSLPCTLQHRDNAGCPVAGFTVRRTVVIRAEASGRIEPMGGKEGGGEGTAVAFESRLPNLTLANPKTPST
jgi:hypothetical protein